MKIHGISANILKGVIKELIKIKKHVGSKKTELKHSY